MRTFIIILASLLLAFTGVTYAQQRAVYSLNSANPSMNWRIKAETEVGNDVSIHNLGYNTANWVAAVVPGTVYTSYVTQGLEQTPEYADNIYKDVDVWFEGKDKKSKGQYERNYWYRTEFRIPAEYALQGKIWLNLDGVNRDAKIFVNGDSLGFIQGHVFRGKYDITNIVDKNGLNTLAILVYVPVPPMNISASPTYIASASWDWMPYVPDLNMGITDEIYLTHTGDVSIVDPWIRTKVPNLTTGELDISMRLKNNSTNTVSATVSGTISPGNIEFTQNVNLTAGASDSIFFNKNAFGQLVISNPKLWWPNGYGKPNLYNCSLVCSVNGQISDTVNVRFGIREYSYDTTIMNKAGSEHVFRVFVNGKPVFLKGGDWGMSEYMLRCRGDEYKTKIRLHKEMNFNVIRSWTGTVTDDEFYEQCDENGIMVWDDFWMITTFIYWPRSKEIFADNVIEKIKRRRNHACLAVWCGANEMTPPKDWSLIYSNAIKTYDANDRHYQPNSNTGNLSGSGPWTNSSPQDYYNSTVSFPWFAASWGMRTELGTPVFVNYESFKKFMPRETMWPYKTNEVVNEMWNKHFFGPNSSNSNPDNYFKTLNSKYDTADNIRDFCNRAQLLNIETNKGMFEGWMHNMWKDATGLIIWMSQSAYPSMVWQTYDYYYDLNGAYWGSKKACEPIHIQMNIGNDNVEVTNTSGENLTNLTAYVEAYDFNGNKYDIDTSVVINIESNTVKPCFKVPFNKVAVPLTEIQFVRLGLKDQNNLLLSENFYWRGIKNSDYTALSKLPDIKPEVSTNIQIKGDSTYYTATITNPKGSGGVVFATRVIPVRKNSRERILPVFMNDNYFTLMPGESKVINMEFETKLLNGEAADLIVKPFHMEDSSSVFIKKFTTNKELISQSDSARLSWEVVGADSVLLDGEIVSLNGSKYVSPDKAKIYKLIAKNGAEVDSLKLSIGNYVPQLKSIELVVAATKIKQHDSLDVNILYFDQYKRQIPDTTFVINWLPVKGVGTMNTSSTSAKFIGLNVGSASIIAQVGTLYDTVNVVVYPDISKIELVSNTILINKNDSLAIQVLYLDEDDNVVAIPEFNFNLSWSISSGKGKLINKTNTSATLVGTTLGRVDVTANISEMAISDALTVTVSTNVAVDPDLNNNEEVQIYPNPAQNKLSVKGLRVGEEIAIYSIEGTMLLQTNKAEVDVSSLSAGIYIARLVGERNATSLVIIRR